MNQDSWFCGHSVFRLNFTLADNRTNILKDNVKLIHEALYNGNNFTTIKL